MNHSVEISDIQTKFERTGGDDHTVVSLSKRLFGILPLFPSERTMRHIGIDAAVPKQIVDEYDRRAIESKDAQSKGGYDIKRGVGP